MVCRGGKGHYTRGRVSKLRCVVDVKIIGLGEMAVNGVSWREESLYCEGGQ